MDRASLASNAFNRFAYIGVGAKALRRALLILIGLGFIQPLVAQRFSSYLSIDKMGKRHRIYPNQSVKLSTLDHPAFRSSILMALDLESQTLSFGAKDYKLSEIMALKVKRNERFESFSAGLAGAGIIFLGLFTFNNLINQDKPLLRGNEIMMPVLLVSPFIVYFPFRNKTFRKNKLTKWQIIEWKAPALE